MKLSVFSWSFRKVLHKGTVIVLVFFVKGKELREVLMKVLLDKNREFSSVNHLIECFLRKYKSNLMFHEGTLNNVKLIFFTFPFRLQELDIR